MHILILQQALAINGSAPERRLFEVGRRWAEEGRQVTVITGNSRLGLPLGGKKIGLIQKEGMALIVLDGGRRRHLSPARGNDDGRNFARRALNQGRSLPHFDLILASSPPAAINRSAYLLSRYHRAPLILELGEMEPLKFCVESSALKKLLAPPFQRAALKACSHARSIIATNPKTAAEAAKLGFPDKEIHLLPPELAFEPLFERYSQILTAICC